MLSYDPSLDYQYVDWLQSIMYYVRLSEGTYATGIFCADCALKRENNKGFVISGEGVELAQHTCIWELWAAGQVTPFKPARGDKFVDGQNQAWIVAAVDYCTNTTRYRLTCQLQGQGG